MNDYDIPCIVLDNGSGMSKSGFSGDDAPRSVFPSIIGRPRFNPALVGVNYKERYVGDEAQRKRGVMSIWYPIKKGIVVDWDDMEAIWDYTFKDLRVCPEEHPIFTTEAPLNPKNNREKIAQIMMEKFSAKGFFIQLQAVLSVYASGRNTGVVLDSGEGITHVLPIHDGYTVISSIQRLNLAGSDLTLYLQRLLNSRGYSLTTSAEFEIVRDVKERLCYVCDDFQQETKRSRSSSSIEQTYTLPDGHKLTIGSERFECPELLFNPSPAGKEEDGVHKQVINCVEKCDSEFRKLLYSNIILSGGSTMFPGIQERLEKEMKSVVPHNRYIRALAPPERKYSTWIGGSILGSLTTFRSKMLITKQEYSEHGPNIVHRKCF